MTVHHLDLRYVYGARCSWHGPIREIVLRDGLPACPICGGVLFEMQSKGDWDTGIARLEAAHPGYAAFFEHLRTRKGHVPLSYVRAAAARWDSEHGTHIQAAWETAS